MPTTPRARRHPQRGMVTAELAVGLLVSALVLFGLSGVVGMVILQGRCQDAATQIARQEARGDAAEQARARRLAPRNATVTVTKADGWVEVGVRAERSWGRLGPIGVSANARMPLEPGEGT